MSDISAQKHALHKQKNILGNTISKMSRSRNWVFTLNNYTKEDIKDLMELKVDYVFQEEKGEQGTPHLQGYICCPNALTLSGVKKIHTKAHWEIAKGNKVQCVKYCTKEETRIGEIFSNFEYKKYILKEKVKRNKVDSLADHKIQLARGQIWADLIDLGYNIVGMNAEEVVMCWLKEYCMVESNEDDFPEDLEQTD